MSTTLTIEQIKEHLKNGDSIEVSGIWRYWGKHMRCYDDNCCETDFGNIEEVVEDIVDKAGKDLSNVELK